MQTWFECTVKYEKNGDDGKIATVSEKYLVDALSHAEAETRITEKMKPYISGEFTIARIIRARISELFPNEDGDKWYKCKVNFISLDEEKGLEKRVSTTMMAQACDLKDAWDGLHEGMKGSLADYEVASITETTIMDVYKYEVIESE